jgi:hypothetical protein
MSVVFAAIIAGRSRRNLDTAPPAKTCTTFFSGRVFYHKSDRSGENGMRR